MVTSFIFLFVGTFCTYNIPDLMVAYQQIFLSICQLSVANLFFSSTIAFNDVNQIFIYFFL